MKNAAELMVTTKKATGTACKLIGLRAARVGPGNQTQPEVFGFLSIMALGS